MSLPGHWLPPSSSLPPVRSLRCATEEQITSALRTLHRIYCPLRLPISISKQPHKVPSTTDLVDSGYASQDEDEDDLHSDTEDALAALRADEFERSFVVRWLTALIAYADEVNFTSEDTRENIINDVAFVLSSFSDSTDELDEDVMTRVFTFPTSLASASPKTIEVRLNDAPLSGTDHTDVGLQSWGASIILSSLMCESPARFGLDKLQAQSAIIELGAGTGLVSLTLATVLPHLSVAAPVVIATDYHPAVLDNLRSNITTNFPSHATPPVQTMLLDWSSPSLPDKPSSMLVAADVVYAQEHATLLRDCAARLLASDGVFWLMVTVRTIGKFEGIADTVEAAFSAHDCPGREGGRVLKILGKERLEKRAGVGRGDESGYMLYRIGWHDHF